MSGKETQWKGHSEANGEYRDETFVGESISGCLLRFRRGTHAQMSVRGEKSEIPSARAPFCCVVRAGVIEIPRSAIGAFGARSQLFAEPHHRRSQLLHGRGIKAGEARITRRLHPGGCELFFSSRVKGL